MAYFPLGWMEGRWKERSCIKIVGFLSLFLLLQLFKSFLLLLVLQHLLRTVSSLPATTGSINSFPTISYPALDIYRSTTLHPYFEHLFLEREKSTKCLSQHLESRFTIRLGFARGGFLQAKKRVRVVSSSFSKISYLLSLAYPVGCFLGPAG